jgi:putative lipoic acid-binding regulatory protein
MDADRLDKIKASLDEVHEWPSAYMFKFIVPTVSNKFEELMKLFPKEVDTYTKMSREGKYTSVTIKEILFSADDVMSRYNAVHELGEIIAL